MPKKKHTTREAIIAAALDLVREGGWAGLSARSLAERLDSSTMPLYSAIGSMELLRTALISAAEGLLADYQGRSWSPSPLMDMAIGYVAFAREERKLFLFLFGDAGGPSLTGEDLERRMGENGSFARLASLRELSRDQGQALAFHSWIYIHGLATLVANGILAPTDQELVDWLGVAGGAFWTAVGGGTDG